ncbi:MAG: hypothetical protein AB7F59_07135 [Bdellovibrionales bacterium]
MKMSKDPVFGDYLGYYTLMYKSLSLQKPRTPAEPRVIVYGRDGKSIMTFLNHIDTRGKDALEFSCWREALSAFEFYEMDFKVTNKINPNHGKNPISCQRCHGVDPRPNFDAYNTWTGAFGSLSRNGCSSIHKETLEYAYFKEFSEKHRNAGRYQYLPQKVTPPKFNGYSFFPPRPLDSCSFTPQLEPADDGQMYVESDIPSPLIAFQNAVSTEPNAQMLDLLTPLNFLRIARIIGTNTQLQKFHPALEGLKQGCDMKLFFPESVLKQGKAFEEVLANAVLQIELDFEERKKAFLTFNRKDPYDPTRAPINFSARHSNLLGSFRYTLEKMGIPFFKISMGFLFGTYEFTTNNRFSSDSIESIIKIVYEKYQLPLVFDVSCENLANMSQEALTGYQAPILRK